VGGVEREEIMHACHIPDIESLAGSKIITLSWMTSKSTSKRQRKILSYCISCPNLPIQYRQPRFQRKPSLALAIRRRSPNLHSIIIKLTTQWRPKSPPEYALAPFDCQSPGHTIPTTIHLPQDPLLQPKVSFSPPQFHTFPPTASHLQRCH
jgi:hypothetical protein